MVLYLPKSHLVKSEVACHAVDEIPAGSAESAAFMPVLHFHRPPRSRRLPARLSATGVAQPFPRR